MRDGLGKNRSYQEITNAAYLAKEKGILTMPWVFDRASMTSGILSCDAYYYLPRASDPPVIRRDDLFKFGESLSELEADDLRILSIYVWNEGLGHLKPPEIERAKQIVQDINWESASR